MGSKRRLGARDRRATRNTPGGLSPKQAAFVREYMFDFNGAHAAIRAGYSARVAKQRANRLLQHPAIAAAVSRAQAEAAAKMEVKAEDLRREVKAIALSNIGDVLWFGPGGIMFNVPDSRQLPRHVLAAIESVESRDTPYGKVVKVKMHSKEAAQRLMAQLIGALVERHEVEHKSASVQFYLPDNGRRTK